jgi:TonB family protein
MTFEPTPASLEETNWPPSANDRFKESFERWLFGSIIFATALHFCVFTFWPEMTTEDVSYAAESLTAIDLPPEIEIPPPPEAISRPATPIIAAADIDQDITIATTTFEDNPVEELPPPPATVAVTDVAAAPTFTPFTVRPEIKNRDELAQAMEREYPPLLKDAGIGGTVIVHFFIDEEGVVRNSVLARSCGQNTLDEAALKIAPIAQFTPALNRDQRVAVWIQLPIIFNTTG